MAATRALMGATIAGERIFDSAILAIDQIAQNQPLPFVTVSSEDEDAKPSGTDIWSGDGTIDLVIEVGISKAVQLEDNQGAALLFETTDANLELTLGVLMRQITAALFGRGGGKWGDAFRSFVSAVETISVKRGVPIEGGTRFAARQAVIRIRTIADPPFGPVIAGTPFDKFFAAADADTDATVKRAADALRGAIEGDPVGWPEYWNALAVAGGIPADQEDGVGIASLAGDDQAVTVITIDPDGWDLTDPDGALPPESP